MTFNLKLRPELEAQLQESAKASGLTVDQYLSRLIEEAVPVRRDEAALSLLDTWEKEDTTDDRDELEKRRREWRSLKTAMNEGHSSDRILFP
jgi:hypothetical protein